MADIAQRDFTAALFALLRETFEGPGGSMYLDRGAGLFQTLDAVTAETASHVPSSGAQTIAAHCAHLAYYVRANHDGVLRREQPLDWNSSWRLQQVGEREWEELKVRRREYDALLETLESLETWDAQQVGDGMAILAHTAYHLGTIRHALRIVWRTALQRRVRIHLPAEAPRFLTAHHCQAQEFWLSRGDAPTSDEQRSRAPRGRRRRRQFGVLFPSVAGHERPVVLLAT